MQTPPLSDATQGALQLTADALGGPASALTLLPRRGALVTRWQVGGRDVLYMDGATLADPTKNVRGGIPLLFPSPGKLDGGRFERAAHAGAMKQHGFARDLPWDVVRSDLGTATLALASSDATRAQFPWDFALRINVSLASRVLRLDVRIENIGRESLPFGFGIHPYLAVEDKTLATISTAATSAYDNVKHAVVPFRGFDLAHGETDLHLLDHGSTVSTLSADGRRVTVRTSPEFGRWVVWTLPGRGFVCLEPWTAPSNALNSGAGLIELPAGAAKDLWIELELSDGDGVPQGSR